MEIWNLPMLLAAMAGLAAGILVTLLVRALRHRGLDPNFRILAENIPGVIYLCRNDERFRMLFLNNAIETLTGYPKEEFLTDRVSFADLYHPDDVATLRAEVDRALAARRRFHLQYRIRHRSGEWRWVDEVGAGVFRGDSLVYLEGFLSDVTERRQTEEALRLSEELNRRLLETASGGIVLVGADGLILLANHEAQRILGISRDELNGRFVSDFRSVTIDESGRPLDPADYPVTRCLTTGEPQPAMTVGVRQADGRVVWGVFTAVPFHDTRPDHPAGAVVTFVDVTPLKQAQAELKAGEERLRAIVENTPNVAIQGYDEEGRVLFWNRAAERIYGFTRDEATGRPLSALILDEGSMDEFRAILAGMKATGRPTEPSEWEFRRKDGSRGVAYSTIFPIRGSNDEMQFICMDVDITALKRAEEAVRAAQEELLARQRSETERVEAELARARDELVRQTEFATIGKVSAQIAHDIRNPLGSITNAVFYLRRKVPADSEVCREYLDMIDAEARTCDQIINGLLDVSRAWEPDPQTIDLESQVDAAIARLNAPSGVRLTRDVHPSPFRFSVDPVHFRRVLDNLLQNALDAVGAAGEITISAQQLDNRVRILIADNGAGVEPELREAIFEPFHTTKAKGTGLGLSICRQIIARHGGSLHIADSERGAVFEIDLPLSGDLIS